MTPPIAGKKALLVGCADYKNPKFIKLPAQQNIDALAAVLSNPEIGGFHVDTLLNEPSSTVSQAIEGFFKNAKPNDVLLLYVSCHGVLDPAGRLYFATSDIDDKLPDSTGISALRVKEWQDDCRARRIVLLLDCCYSGAFNGGLTRHGSFDAEETFKQLRGEGSIVITASDRLELAHESAFTDAVVRGLDTGDADRNGNGEVSVHELYEYVHDDVQSKYPDQNPKLQGTFIGRFILAKNRHPPLPLPSDLRQHINDQEAWKRRGAVYGLELLITGDHPAGLKRTARQELHRLCKGDHDVAVREAACRALHTVASDPSPRWPAIRQRLTGAALALAAMISLSGPIWWPSQHAPIACSPSTRPPDGVLSLGTLLPNNTGGFVYTGPALNAGVQLAMKDINDAGGIPNIADVKLDPINQKDEGDPSKDTASRSTDELLNNQVDVIIGPATSAVGLKVIDKVTCAGVILFSPSNTSRVFTTYPDHGLYFRTEPPAGAEATVLSKLVVADGNSTVVVMSRDDPYGNDLREATVAAIRESGRQVLDSFHYDPNVRDYTKDIQRIKDKNPDAIILIGFSESAGILADMIQKGLDPKNKRIYGTSNISNSLAGQVNAQDPGVLAGMKGTTPDTGDEMFVKRLRETKPGLRDLNRAAQAYDAVIITALAAAVAGTDAPAAIAREINGVTKGGEKCASFAACMLLVKERKDIAYVGASGPLEFSDSGEPCSATYLVCEIQADGTVKILRKERVSLTRSCG